MDVVLVVVLAGGHRERECGLCGRVGQVVERRLPEGGEGTRDAAGGMRERELGGRVLYIQAWISEDGGELGALRRVNGQSGFRRENNDT